jgi:hypothetical protein
MKYLTVSFHLIPGPWGKIATRPVSLLMILHKCHEYYEFSDELAQLRNEISQIKIDERPGEEDFGMVSTIAKKAHGLLSSLKGVSPTVLDLIQDLGQHYGEIALGPLEAQILGDLESIRRMVQSELESRKFLYIPENQNDYFQKTRLFGNDVYRSFPDARAELTSAGNAFAMELYSGCVFHLMRVAEHGLRKLARRLNVRLTDKAKFLPLDFADWDKVITGIKNKITAARLLSRGPKKQARLEMYSNAADHCEYMKDIWRNTASHARRPYIKSEALAAMDRVKAFMQFLSVAMKARG